MTEAYYTETEKLVRFKRVPWTWDEQDIIRDTLAEKGYYMNVVSRLGCDRQPHDAWQIDRIDTPRIIEQLFRQRLHVEVQPEGKGKAGIIFVYDNRASEIINAVNRFQKNRR